MPAKRYTLPPFFQLAVQLGWPGRDLLLGRGLRLQLDRAVVVDLVAGAERRHPLADGLGHGLSRYVAR